MKSSPSVPLDWSRVRAPCWSSAPAALTFDHVEIKLLGFKSRKEFKFEHNIKHSFFIYPDEMVRLRAVLNLDIHLPNFRTP